MQWGMQAGFDFKQPQCVCNVIPSMQILCFEMQLPTCVSVRVHQVKHICASIQLCITDLQTEIRKIQSR